MTSRWEVGHRWPHPTFLLMTRVCLIDLDERPGEIEAEYLATALLRPIPRTRGESERVTNESR
jgi:hypothetical protein